MVKVKKVSQLPGTKVVAGIAVLYASSSDTPPIEVLIVYFPGY